MKPENFKSDRAGRVVKHPRGYWAFIPDNFPPEIGYSSTIVKLLGEASGYLGEFVPDLKALPKGKQTIHLKFQDFKAQVCKPYAR